MKTILLAEDNIFIMDIYASQLRRDGYKVDIAKDGQMALEKVRNNYLDLLLLDLDLPKMNGLEVLKMLRDDPKTKNVKVVIISNLNEEKYSKDIADLGVKKCFLKVEVTPEAIAQYVKEILK